MHTIQLKVEDNIYNNIMLTNLRVDGLEIDKDNNNEISTKENICKLLSKHRIKPLEIDDPVKLQQELREEQPLWDRVALREAVIKAIVHNDYTTQNPPLFEIFSNRIEITSTGGLSTIKNMEDFFSGYSKPISREIMRIYKDLELVEHLGSGLNRILEVYSKDSFVVKENYMRNVFYSNTKKLKDNEGVKTLLQLIEKYPNKKTPFFVKELNTSVKNIERWIKKLRDEGKVEFIGSSKTGGYYKI